MALVTVRRDPNSALTKTKAVPVARLSASWLGSPSRVVFSVLPTRVVLYPNPLLLAARHLASATQTQPPKLTPMTKHSVAFSERQF